MALILHPKRLLYSSKLVAKQRFSTRSEITSYHEIATCFTIHSRSTMHKNTLPEDFGNGSLRGSRPFFAVSRKAKNRVYNDAWQSPTFSPRNQLPHDLLGQQPQSRLSAHQPADHGQRESRNIFDHMCHDDRITETSTIPSRQGHLLATTHHNLL